ncbi:MAG: hypothetical protein QOI92_1161, partial [Chloroflexota bacterium]|nr:hypothetical protein [Chloroflexota bacterium]
DTDERARRFPGIASTPLGDVAARRLGSASEPSAIHPSPARR